KFDFKTDTADAKNIILSTLTHLEGHTIEKYLGMATEHSFLESHLVESEASDMIHQSYDELAQKLKAHALENKANAVLGINYQLTPMPSDQGMGQFRYKLTCTGNLVYLFKLNTHA
ncbi:MAG: YbjQ family protein, partial [Proteobacteria bacterium]|nr:YbjQ family protein [Pseudomonadota bacterium]